MRLLAATDRVFSIFCRSAAGILILVIMVLVFGEIISRLFGTSHEFVPGISSWAMVWMTYMMLGIILKARGHISIDILLTRIPRRYSILLLTFIDVVSLAFAVLLVYGGIRYDLMVKQMDIYAVTVQFIPLWIVRICVPLGGFFLAFFSCRHLIDDARTLTKRPEKAL